MTNVTDPAARLRAIWPDAVRIEQTVCHCRRRALMLSFVLPNLDRLRIDRDGLRQECGYWCTVCDFSNAGSRLPTDDDKQADEVRHAEQ